jgi:uncharacterized repeat protein (TIGR03803 family)
MRASKSALWLTFSGALLAAAFLCAPTAQAQPKFKVLHQVGGSLFSGLTLDAKGNLYGATAAGGPRNESRIFELRRSSGGKWALSVVLNFYGPTDGCGPNGGLIFDTAGDMYGTTSGCGTNGFGTIFELTQGSQGWTLKVLHQFGSETGTSYGVVMGKGGNLYGVAGGGLYESGTVIELVHGSGGWHETVLYNFDGLKTGFNPGGPLLFDAAGRLYGVTSGTYNQYAGTVFRLGKPSDNWRHTKLWQFDGPDGAGPSGGLIFDGSGNLYGTTPGGGGNDCLGMGYPCGTAYKLTPNQHGGWNETVIYGFLDGSNGFGPSGGLVSDKQGNLYGTTAVGGIGSSCPVGCGVVYKLTPGVGGTWKYTVLHKFNGNDGSLPVGPLVIDDKGNLYGTAFTVVYEITP